MVLTQTGVRQRAFMLTLMVALAACSGERSGEEQATAVAETPSTKNTEVSGSAQTQGASSEAASPSEEIVAIYQRSCISCHLSGAAGAPKSHDAAAWAPKLAKGMDTMIANINNGLNAMPPKGLCFDCTDEQYQSLIEFMAGPKP